MIKRKVIKVSAIILAVLMPVLTASMAFAQETTANSVGSDSSGNSEPTGTSEQDNETKVSKYDKLDINELTGHGKEPEDISVSAGATYQEKAWYEYITYSDHAVASYRLDDDSRILFFDPYSYSNSMVMDVDFDVNTTQFGTMSSYSVSSSTSKTISACSESTYTNSSSTQTSGKDTTGTSVNSEGSSKTIYNHYIDNETTGTVNEKTTYHYNNREYDTSSETIGSSFSSATGVETGGEAGFLVGKVNINLSETITIGNGRDKTTNHNVEWYVDEQNHETKYSPDYKTTTKYLGDDTVENNSTSTTEGWTQLSARVTKTLGSSSSTSNSWSESESSSVTKTYAATHFASDGVTPLPWAVVHYKVQMPMKCCLQVKYSGEWITLSTIYSLLTTVQGTCRAWMQNGQTYYEDWGNGEPVVETEFWSNFLTVDRLVEMYTNPEKDKLYPVGGAD